MRLEINYKKAKNGKKHKLLEGKWYTNKQQMDHWKIKEKIKRYVETNDNEDKTIQNLWDIAKSVLRTKFIAI